MPNHDLETHHRHHHHHATANPPSPPKPSPKLLSIFLKFIVMSLILSLFLLFLGLAAILLLHLLLAGSFLHRRRQRLLHRTTPPRTSSFSLRDIQNHLPPFQYPAAEESPASDDCSICLEYFNEGEICRLLPVCDHVFHARCVDTWLTKVPNCPICRTRVRLDAGGPSDSMISDDETKFLWAMGVGR
ncbi:Zinc finger, RING/FYVE/PHD-type [Cynara cardunculus var. scolymus]|uniref:Zinc finger, RING/FYVE/PHD-type n=1 Tax=Cynara cardunculus var. scolymus TaxID=59895 RepID=A0A103YME5_CYNCS|nr:Zinc finger, RING/FYVE/PHD-type [Cynara cardunculus var. scolymus]